ncbi:MAG: hypothetical protein K6F39_09065 [Lachnospiraceae bacterium]|nr:hypothetical protein [Lachnospiraceae bacterium]
MNYIEIMGGLGNQFFQYTFSKYLEKITGNKSVLYMNFFDYIKNSPSLTNRENMLDKIKGNFSSVNGSIECRKIIEESYGYKASSEDDLIFYRGYWQNKSYFDEVKDISELPARFLTQ